MSKTILITGSSSGIGKATALYFQDKGWNVIATMRSPEKETELTKLNNVLVTKLDVTDEATIKASIDEGIEKFGKIDVVLNNAGYGTMGPVESFPIDNIRRQFDVNVIGLLAVTQAALPHFRKNRDGMFINVSSIGGRMTFPLMSLYHGTKFAVEGISESMRYELSEIGCSIKIVEPGAIKTDFVSRSLDMQNDENMTEYQPLIGNLMNAFESIGDMGSPASLVAEVVYTAATDDTDTLRYTAGEDAAQFMEAQKNLDDNEFAAMIKERFGL